MWLVQRWVKFRGGEEILTAQALFVQKNDAEKYVAERSGDERILSDARLMTIEGTSAVDTGMDVGDYLKDILMVQDVGFALREVPVASPVALVKA